jgi:hypothetical protein
MKNLLLLIIFCNGVLAQTIPLNTVPKVLDKNKVKASINTVNNKFWNIYGNGKAAYEVPAGKGTHAQFANSIWIGGLDHNNILHVSANTYRQSGEDFWPGPLDTSNIGAYNASNTAVYNKLWKVDCDDINSFVHAFSNGWVGSNTYTVPADILNYPAKGIGNFQKNLEPFIDANNNGLYDPATGGDYPVIKGHQQILSIYNDKLNQHTETQGAAMGIEIHERAYAYSEPGIHDTMQAINYTTFYHYTIYNRSGQNYFNVFISDWSDVDLGYYSDDYIGTDSINNFTYCYNASSNDPSSFGFKGYGSKPPVVGHAIIKTMCGDDGIDNDNDLETDEAGEQFILNRSTYYNNNQNIFAPQTTNPVSAQEFYGYMSGYWKDNTPFTYGSNAYGGSNPKKMVYTGNPGANIGWTESTSGNTSGDRRVLSTSGPFTFPAGGKIEWGYAIVFSQDTSQQVNTISQFNSRVRRDVRNVLIYDQAHQAPQCAPPITTGIGGGKQLPLDVLIYPNPVQRELHVTLLRNTARAEVNIFDLSGRKVLSGLISNADRAILDLSSLEKGAYIIEITESGQKHCHKLIRE